MNTGGVSGPSFLEALSFARRLMARTNNTIARPVSRVQPQVGAASGLSARADPFLPRETCHAPRTTRTGPLGPRSLERGGLVSRAAPEIRDRGPAERPGGRRGAREG